MQTRFLESFVAVVEAGSLAEAARRLNITPAGIAQRVKALEDEMGIVLVIRSGRVVGPTEAGAAILPGARNIIREARELSAAATGEVSSGDLRIGSIATALLGLMPDILKTFSMRFPGFDLFLEPGASMDLYRRVVDGELDAAVIVEPYFALPKTCSFQVMREEPFVVIARAEHAGADPHDLLATQPFIRYDRRQWGARLANDYLRREGIKPKERFELDSLEAIAVMVDRNLGVSIVPDWLGPWPEGLSLAKLALREPAPKRRVGVIWRTAQVRAAVIRNIVLAANG